MDFLNQLSPSASEMEEVNFEEVEHAAPAHSNTGTSGRPSIGWVDISREGTYDTEGTKQDLKDMGIPWDDRVQEIEKELRPAAPVRGVPPFYLEVLEAGSGASGTVVLCLPRSYAIAARYWRTQDTPQSIAKLKSNLVALKVIPSANMRIHEDEARLNEIIVRNMESATTSSVPQFAKIRGQCKAVPRPNHQTADFVQPWLAFDAIVPSLSLSDVVEHHLDGLVGVAEILIVHIFSEVANALRFIHSCSPPIAHKDVLGGNVLLELTDGLPRVVLNDFNISTIASENDHGEFEHDFVQLHMMITDLYQEAWKSGILKHDGDLILPKSWIEFENSFLLVQTPTSYTSVTKSTEPLAHSVLESLTSQKKAEVATSLRQASGPQETKLLAQFQSMGLLSR